MTDPNYNPNANYFTAGQGGNPINVSGLGTTQTPITPAQPDPTPTSPSSAVDATVPTPAADPNALGATEKTLQQQLKDIADLNTADTGKTAYAATQEEAAGLKGFMDTQTSLSKQILALQAEAKSIPDQMQVNAEGKGMTTGGLAPLTTAALRRNSISTNILGAQLAATQLDIASAHTQVEKAVAMKYGPIEEDIAAKTKNLNLMLQDPALSEEKKARAQAQLEVQNTKAAAVAQAKANFDAIQKIAVEAAARKADALTLKQIAAAKTPQEAEAIATAKGVSSIASKDTAVEEVGGRKILINKQTGETIKDLGAVIKVAANAKPFVSGTLSYSPQDKAEDSQALDNSRGTDGFVDPTIYQNLYKAWIAAGGRLEDFIKTYPPKNYVNPANAWLPAYLMPGGKSKATAATGGSDLYNNL